jgi:hypothetical protein
LHEGIAEARCGIAYVTPRFLEREWTVHEVRGMVRHGRLKALILDGVDERAKHQLLEMADREIPGFSPVGMTPDQVADSVFKLIRPGPGIAKGAPARR